jgi:Na+/melibiose symporter-like transporter
MESATRGLLQAADAGEAGRHTDSSVHSTGDSRLSFSSHDVRSSGVLLSGELPFLASARAAPLEEASLKPIPFARTLGFGIGHHLNDMCASCWFTYLLVYLQKGSVSLPSGVAGAVFLAGQVADAVATPMVGLASDATPPRISCCRALGLGRRKLWHFGGTIVASAAFVLTFLGRTPFPDGSRAEVVYLAIFAGVFNFGWASVQVSHLALIPEIHSSPIERTRLQTARFGSTIAANLEVFLLFALVSMVVPRSLTFAALAGAIVAIGLVTTIVFHASTPEPSPTPSEAVVESQRDAQSATAAAPPRVPEAAPVAPTRTRACDWFARAEFYTTAATYMSTRLLANVSQTYLQFFAVDTLRMDVWALSAVPVTLYVASLLATSYQAALARRASRALAYTAGGLLSVGALIGLSLLPPAPDPLHLCVFPLVALLGVGVCGCTVTSVSIIDELIGEATDSSAFVYGALSFTDKLSGGVTVYLIQLHRQHIEDSQCSRTPSQHGRADCLALDHFILVVLSYGCAIAVGCGMLFAWLNHAARRSYSCH